MAAHIRKHNIRYVLKRNIQILADFGVRGHLLQDVLREIGRVGIMDAYPLDLRYLRELLYQIRKSALLVQIQPVVGGILGYQHQLANSARGKTLRLFHQLLDGH